MTARVTTSDLDRKRRPDAWEIQAGLGESDLMRVFGWARTLGYRKAIELIRAELKLEPPSMSAFQDWYQWYSRIESADRVHKAVVDSKAIRDLAQDCGDVSEAMIAALESEAAAAILGGEPDRIRLLVSLALKARGAARSQEALQLEIRKYQDGVRSSVDTALAALAEKIKGNAVALRHYAAFRDAVMAGLPASSRPTHPGEGSQMALQGATA